MKLINEKKDFFNCCMEPLPILGMGRDKTAACLANELLSLRIACEGVELFLQGVGSTFLFFAMAMGRALGYAANADFQSMATGMGGTERERPHESS